MDFKITFNKPYKFEGAEYTEIDLSGLENLTVKDMNNADKQFFSTGNIANSTETSLVYACILASKATGKPVEFFENLPAKEGIKVKAEVVSFLFEKE
jgi:hypothetical protein